LNYHWQGLYSGIVKQYSQKIQMPGGLAAMGKNHI